MLRRNMSRLFVRLVILTTLVGALFFTPMDPTRNTVRAGVSCPFCEEGYAACVASCPPLGQPGHFSCIGNCNLEFRDCEYWYC